MPYTVRALSKTICPPRVRPSRRCYLRLSWPQAPMWPHLKRDSHQSFQRTRVIALLVGMWLPLRSFRSRTRAKSVRCIWLTAECTAAAAVAARWMVSAALRRCQRHCTFPSTGHDRAADPRRAGRAHANGCLAVGARHVLALSCG